MLAVQTTLVMCGIRREHLNDDWDVDEQKMFYMGREEEGKS